MLEPRPAAGAALGRRAVRQYARPARADRLARGTASACRGVDRLRPAVNVQVGLRLEHHSRKVGAGVGGAKTGSTQGGDPLPMLMGVSEELVGAGVVVAQVEVAFLGQRAGVEDIASCLTSARERSSETKSTSAWPLPAGSPPSAGGSSSMSTRSADGAPGTCCRRPPWIARRRTAGMPYRRTASPDGEANPVCAVGGAVGVAPVLVLRRDLLVHPLDRTRLGVGTRGEGPVGTLARPRPVLGHEPEVVGRVRRRPEIGSSTDCTASPEPTSHQGWGRSWRRCR